MNLGKQFKEGLLTNNPVLVQLLGMCSVLAISTSLFNGIGMGICVTLVLIGSAFIVVIAGFVTVVDLLLKAYVPALSSSLGVFIPLIVVNCIILARAESVAYKSGIGASFMDGLFQGIGYTITLVILCIVREFLGYGTFGGGLIDVSNGFRIVLGGADGIRILPEGIGASLITMPCGGFITLGIMIAVMNWAMKKAADKSAAKEETK